MSIFEIILIGYMVNIVSIVLVMLFSLLDGLLRYSFQDKVQYMKNILELQKNLNELRSIKQDLRNKNISTLIQEDLYILFPFAGILVFLNIFIRFITFSLTEHVINKSRRRIEELKVRLNEK